MAKAFRIVSKDNEGKEKIVIVKKPNHSQLSEAQFYASSIFNKAKQAGACLRSKLEEFLEAEGVWGAKEKQKTRELTDVILANLKKLETGKDKDGTKVKLSEARKLAIDTRRLRLELNLLLAKKREHDAYTVEGQAENARFDFLVYLCTFDENGKNVFENVNDYYDKQEEEYAAEAAAKLASITFNLEEDWERKLPENEFLINHKFVDANLRYVDKDGNWVNAEGNRVDEEGRLLSEKVEPEVSGPAEFEDDVYNVN